MKNVQLIVILLFLCLSGIEFFHPIFQNEQCMKIIVSYYNYNYSDVYMIVFYQNLYICVTQQFSSAYDT